MSLLRPSRMAEVNPGELTCSLEVLPGHLWPAREPSSDTAARPWRLLGNDPEGVCPDGLQGALSARPGYSHRRRRRGRGFPGRWPCSRQQHRASRGRQRDSRDLDRGNAHPGSIGKDFARFGFDVWPASDDDHPVMRPATRLRTPLSETGRRAPHRSTPRIPGHRVDAAAPYRLGD